MLVFGGGGTKRKPFGDTEMTHVFSLDWHQFPAGAVQAIRFPRISFKITTWNMKIPLPSAGYFITINKIRLLLWIVRPKKVNALFVGNFLWLNSLKGYPVEISRTKIARFFVMTFDEKTELFSEFSLAISGSDKFSVTTLFHAVSTQTLP